MLPDQTKSALTQYTQLAKKIIYKPERAKVLAKLMDSDTGPVQAVLTVLAGIENVKPVPPDIRTMLSVNVLMIILDLAEQVTGQDIPEQVLMAEIQNVLKAVANEAQTPGGAEAPAMETQDPQGGVAEEPGMLARMQQGI